MIDSDRIVDLLKLAGVSDPHILEELTDHYLSAIEEKMESGKNHQTAVRETFQDIASFDYSYLKKKKKKRRFWFFTLLGLLIFSSSLFFIYQKEPCYKAIASFDQKMILPPSAWPIVGITNEITSSFGSRMHPIHLQEKMHNGIDIKAAHGTPVVATADGIVIDAGFHNLNGYFILVKHNKKYATKYNHLSKISVQQCDRVISGQVIGNVGNSGISLRPHLHYEILQNDVPVDPMEYIVP